MKDLELRDILAKQDRQLINISVYRNGRWSFASLTNPTRVSVDQSFYLISFPFGLVKEGQANPGKFSVLGKPGDYVSQDRQGRLALVTESMYALLFPKPQAKTTSYPKSTSLKNPNYLTKIQQESLPSDSDKVLIGDREFSLPSTAKKTLTVIETPVGQSKVFYDTSAIAVVYDYETGTMVEVEVPDKPSSSTPSY